MTRDDCSSNRNPPTVRETKRKLYKENKESLQKHLDKREARSEGYRGGGALALKLYRR